MTTDLYDQRTPQERFRRSVWATFLCWVIILFVADGLPALGDARAPNHLAERIVVTGVISVPVTVWFQKRKIRREQAAEERQAHD